MLKDFAPRLYQQTILGTAALHNTLVVLPTGMGKTAIAFMLAAQRLKQYPDSRILVLSPTKPLCEQHAASFRKHLEVKGEEVVLFTGEVKPEKREELWKEAKIIISTPQGLENDIINKKINLEEVSLLVLDEIHHATGDYAYVFIAKQYNNRARFPRILGLTASPGSDLEKIKEICQNTFIEKVEVRTDKDSDVQPYIQKVEHEWVKVELPEEFKRIKEYLETCYKSKLKEAQGYGYCGYTGLNKSELLKLQGQLQGKIAAGEREVWLFKSISLIAEALKVQHALELLETQGVNALSSYLEKLQKESLTSKVRALKNLVGDGNFKSALVLVRELAEKRVKHPKLTKLREIVRGEMKEEEIKKEKGGKERVKIIVFTQIRDNALEIMNELNGVEGVKAKLFVGQLKKGETGLSQKEQKEILEEFRAGKFNVCVMTSVGEEGLDVPAVDLVVFYEPIPSAIRHIQRCVPGETKILCVDGLYKQIKEIKAGDIILSINKRTLRLEPKKVLKTFQNESQKLIRFNFVNGIKIEVTEEHPLLTRNGWKEAKNVEVGEEIASINKAVINPVSINFFDLLPKETYFVDLNRLFKELKNKGSLMFKEISILLNQKGIKTNKKNLFGYSKNKAIPIKILDEVAKLQSSSLKALLNSSFIVKSKYGKKPLKLTPNIFPDFMWLVGIIATDGDLRTEISTKWRTITHRIRVVNKNKRIIEKVRGVLKKIGLKSSTYINDKEIYGIEVANLILGEILLKLGIKNKNKTHEIEASGLIYRMPEELIAAYLSGVFDGDGNYNRNPKNWQQQIRIGTSSKKFAEDIQNLLLRLGIYSKVLYSHRKELRIIYNKKAFFDCDFYSVEFYYKNNVKKFFDYGFIIKKRFLESGGKRLNKLNKSIDNDVLWVKVKEKSKVNKLVKTYNLRVEDNDSYIASNTIIHNCGRTGRLEEGKVLVLMTEKTRDEGYRWSAFHKEKKMHRELEKLKKEFSLGERKEGPLNKFIPKEQEVLVLADYREKSGGVVKELVELGVSLRLEQLESADYILSGRVGVEKKEVGDFVASIIDGRLLEQVKNLKRNFERSLLVIEGEEDIYAVRKVHANAIRGMLAAITIGYGVPVLYTKNAKDTAGLLAVIAKREQDKERDYVLHERKPLTIKEQQEFLVSSLPGVGVSLAKELLRKFGSVKGLVEASREELQQVEGVGEKISQKIKEVVEREWKEE